MLPELMNNIFDLVERQYNLRSKYTLERKQDYMVYDGLEKLSSLVPKLQNPLPIPKKLLGLLKELKTKINT